MSSTLSIDHPSLVLGGVVDQQLLNCVQQMAKSASAIDAAQQKLNSYLMMKRSLAMTINELVDMAIDVSELQDKLTGVDKAITTTASEYISTRLQAEEVIQQQREQLAKVSVSSTLESPVDFATSSLKRLPLAADSLKLDAQYFSHLNESENDVAATIGKFVRDSTADLGSKSIELGKQASSQVAQQKQNHSLSGTMIIAASCTHRNVQLIEPLIIDPVKAISSWNQLFPADALPVNDPAGMAKAGESTTESKNSMLVISGVKYGSAFVGMVHFIKSEQAQTQADEAIVDQFREKLRLGGWLANVSGEFGVDRSVTDEVKKLLSSQSISAHISLIVSGILPSISSSQMKLSLPQFAQADPSKVMAMVSVLNSETDDAQSSVSSEARAAKRNQQAMAFQQASNSTLIRTLNEVDRGNNQVLDINSLVKAFENFISAINNEGAGVPIGFYTKALNKAQLAKLWISRFFPPQPKTEQGEKI